jgi:hypothetical protein
MHPREPLPAIRERPAGEGRNGSASSRSAGAPRPIVNGVRSATTRTPSAAAPTAAASHSTQMPARKVSPGGDCSATTASPQSPA